MNYLADASNADPSLRFLMREGEMRSRIREFNWRNTGLGDPALWPSSLKTTVALMLDCARPAYIAWGPNFIQLYNDAYIPLLGQLKHPHALGLSTTETWQEIWDDIVDPLFNRVVSSGQAVSMEHKLMLILRNGYLEECYFSSAISPLTDELGNVTGVFAIPWETTDEFIANRRANALRMLVQSLSGAEDMDSIRAAFEKNILENPQDLPFGLWYEVRQDRTGLDLVAAAGIQRGSDLSPELLDPKCNDFYAGLINTEIPAMSCRSLGTDLFQWARPHPPFADPHWLFIKPLCYTNHQRPDGYIMLAANPLRPNDEAQKEFLLAIRLHLENAVRRVNRYELDRREREHQFQTVMAVLPCLVWMTDTTKACVFVNQTWLQFTGRTHEQEIGFGWLAGIHPDDMGEVERYFTVFDEHGILSHEYRLKHASGSYRWILVEGTPRYGMDGEFLGYIGTCIDITDRKNAEQEILSSQTELRTLYDRLQIAREQERCALAREVHDQLGQILSAAKIDIKLLEDSIRPAKATLSRNNIASELQSASHTIEKAIQVVRQLATELRPPELDGQGLPAAIQWHARDFERRTKIVCSVALPTEMIRLNDASRLALFRIFQEALTNILRHAKATKVWIGLACHGNQVRLRVRDNGVGIGPAHVYSLGSMGLKGMHERAALIGGKLMVGRLRPTGTLVVVRVPRSRESNSGIKEVSLNPASYTGDAA